MQPDLGLRLYRTAQGYRCVVTNRTFEPRSDETRTLLQQLGSDPLYVALCDRQHCFRARLTPKPWRCGLPKPPTRFPFLEDGQEERFRAWEKRYHEVADRYAACAVIGDYGVPGVSSDVRPVLTLHDQVACVDGASLA